MIFLYDLRNIMGDPKQAVKKQAKLPAPYPDGMAVDDIAQQFGCTEEDAREIMETVFYMEYRPDGTPTVHPEDFRNFLAFASDEAVELLEKVRRRD